MKIEQTAAPCSRTPPPVEANRICSGAIPVLNRRGQARGAVHGEYTSSFITSDTEGERDTLPRHCDLLDSSMQLDETPQFTSSKYQLEGRLGGGGMGVVYAARHLASGQLIALKSIRPAHIAVPEAVERFLLEAKVLSLIDCPGVVRLLDCEFNHDGIPYMTMELIHGRDLRAELNRRQGVGMGHEAGVDLVVEIARSLGRVHDLGILHRDIKPENIILRSRDSGPTRSQIIDFGVARLLSQSKIITKPSSIVGSLRYMAPEQLTNSHDVTAAADVWSLGVLVLELLAGGNVASNRDSGRYFAGGAFDFDPPPHLFDVWPDAPAPLASIVSRCLQTDPKERFQHATELSEALSSYASGIHRSVAPYSATRVRHRDLSVEPAHLRVKVTQT